MRRSVPLLLLCLLGCGGRESLVPSGTWGGPNIELTVSESGASAQFRCGATGNIATPLALDESEQFSVSGTFEPTLVLGGPRAARYSGSVSGTQMHLEVAVEQDTPQEFDLALGRTAGFTPCNF